MSQFITVSDSAGDKKTHCIEEGQSAFAGTGTHCEIQLSGPGVEPIHCMFCTLGGELKIQDWNTDGKTLLNGQILFDESTFSAGDEATIGDNRIVVAQPAGATRVSAETVVASASANSEKMQQELDLIRKENSQLQTEYDSPPAPAESIDALYDDPFGAGDTDLLRNEIEALQMDLADRDQQVQTLKHQLESGGSGGDMEDTARLVTRMEELLDELQTADGRIKIHEELLRTSDEATQAEQEERYQLEQWVGKIEQRVSDREGEANAENERLNNKVRDLLTQQKHHEQVLEKALQQRVSDGGGEPSDDLVQSLQAQVQDLQQKWQQSQGHCDQLTQQLAVAPTNDEDAQSVTELQQKVMELEMDASRERAQLARERAELAKMQAEIEQQSRTVHIDSESEIRLKAMREHLREIHNEEEIEREERRQSSLGGRIASLFTRIESRQ